MLFSCQSAPYILLVGDFLTITVTFYELEQFEAFEKYAM